MKKIISIALSLIMLFTLCSVGVVAYTVNEDDVIIDAGDILSTAVVYFEDVTANAGDSVTADLVIENNPGITQLTIEVEGITVDSVTNGDMGEATLANNVITVTAASVYSENGCVAKITFTAGTAGDIEVNLTSSALNDEDLVNVIDTVCNVSVKTAPSTVYGDVDGDGDRDSGDLANLKLHLAGAKAIGDEGLVNPDVDGDGNIDSGDLATLKLLLAGATTPPEDSEEPENPENPKIDYEDPDSWTDPV